MNGPGHNFAQGQLRALVERIERANEEKAAIQADIAEIYAECKAFGFDKKIVRKVVQIRAQDSAQRQEEEAMLDLYMSALGMITDETAGPTPRLARPEPSQAPVGVADHGKSSDPSCKQAAPGITGALTPASEAGEAANFQQKPSAVEDQPAHSPTEADDGAGDTSDFPVTQSPAIKAAPDPSAGGVDGADAAAGSDAEPPAAAPPPQADPLEIPAFMRRTAS